MKHCAERKPAARPLGPSGKFIVATALAWTAGTSVAEGRLVSRAVVGQPSARAGPVRETPARPALARLQPGAGASAARVVDPVFDRVVRSLRHKSAISVLLPARLPMADRDDAKMFANLVEIAKTRYTVVVGSRPGCKGEPDCRWITLYAQALSSAAASPLTGSRACLQNGIAAFFEEPPIGAGVGDATLGWDQGNVRYTVAVKAGNRKEAVELADGLVVLPTAPAGALESTAKQLRAGPGDTAC